MITFSLLLKASNLRLILSYQRKNRGRKKRKEKLDNFFVFEARIPESNSKCWLNWASTINHWAISNLIAQNTKWKYINIYNVLPSNIWPLL